MLSMPAQSHIAAPRRLSVWQCFKGALLLTTLSLRLSVSTFAKYKDPGGIDRCNHIASELAAALKLAVFDDVAPQVKVCCSPVHTASGVALIVLKTRL